MSMEIVNNWDYDGSVSLMRQTVYKWKNITIDIVRELYTARENLDGRDGRNLPGALKGKNFSFSGYCDDIGITSRTARNWLERYSHDEDKLLSYDEYEESKKAHVSHNSGCNEWYTPKIYINSAYKTMGEIDLDPASSDKANESIQAKEYYTIKDSGLMKDWKGKIWMNPPYSQPEIGLFVDKFVLHYNAGDITDAIILVNNATDTKWFQKIMSICSLICFTSGRIKFDHYDDNEKGAPLQGQAFLYYGLKLELFKENFNDFGRILYNE